MRVFIRYRSFLVEFLMYKNISSANKDSFCICIHSNFLSSKLSVPAKLSSTILNRCEKSQHPCFVSHVQAVGFFFFFEFLYIYNDVSYVFTRDCFFFIVVCPSILSLYRTFVMNNCWILSNALTI